MAKLVVFVVGVAASGCSPKLSVGYDATAHVRGPLANLQTISRVEAVSGLDAPAPPEGRNYSLGLGFGDRRFTIGGRVSANDVSGSTLAADGPQYVSASGAIDLRYNVLRWRGLAAGVQLAPSRTLLVDSTSGNHSWGSGLRYGGGVSYSLSAFSIYTDIYQEQMIFVDGPAEGNSSRTGVTVGITFQP